MKLTGSMVFTSQKNCILYVPPCLQDSFLIIFAYFCILSLKCRRLVCKCFAYVFAPLFFFAGPWSVRVTKEFAKTFWEKA